MSGTNNPPPSTIDSEVDQLLCDLHDLGFHGKDLAHLETLAEYILKKAAQEANKAQHRLLLDLEQAAMEANDLPALEFIVGHLKTSRIRLTADKEQADVQSD